VDTSTPTPRIDRKERDRSVIRVLVYVLLLNVLVAVLKLVFGYLAGAVSMLADGLHSLMDGMSNIVGLVGIGIARKAPDDDHPYGHRKFEALAALGISMFLFITSWEVLREVLARIRGDHDVEPRIETFLVMGLTLVINVFVTRYESREGRRLRSSILLADSRHTQSDVFVSIGVIASLIAALLDFAVLDIVVAVGIVGFIAHSGYTIVAGAFSVLSDSQVVDPDEVIELATSVEGVLHAHRVRSRGTMDDVHVDLHIHVAPTMTTARAHDLAHEVADRIENQVPGVTDVVVHVEPEGHGEDHAHA
jgi:cation diffusion facilitator family transporter